MNLTGLFTLPSLVSILVSLGLMVGTIFAMRAGASKEAGRIQERVIAALKEETKTLENRISIANVEVDRLKRIIVTIQHAVKKEGLKLSINGEFISLYTVTPTKVGKTPIRKSRDIKIIKGDGSDEKEEDDDDDEVELSI